MNTCLTEQQLDDLAGCDPAAIDEPLKTHLEHCPRCRNALAECRDNLAFATEIREDLFQLGQSEANADFSIDSILSSIGKSLPDPEATPPAEAAIPGYEIIREIHRGGQGVVYQAIQKTTKRRVAIKVMKEGPFAGKRDKARFEREVHILGALSHSGIVAIHDSGTAAGNFYFVMDYITGQPLDVHMAGKRWSIEETLRLFVKICEAVNAAHLLGVIHRDLKPGNIRIDADGQPRILDFGLAKVATGRITDDPVPQVMTVTGQFMGSLPWASPEQAEAIPGRIDMRTDVYSLGVILYQMLTGKLPYEVVGSMRDVLDNILKIEPDRPSTIRREINDEVDTIVLKCLHKERERRYQTAGELARDIGHYLAGEPIEAKRDSTWYVLKKGVLRYRTPVAVVAGFVLMLAIALLVTVALWRRAVTQRDRAVLAEGLAQDRERAAQLAYADGAIKAGTALHLAGRAPESRAAFERAREALGVHDETSVAADIGLYRSLLGEIDAGLYRSLREFEAPVNTIRGHTDGLMAVAWFPDDVRACSASEDGTVRLWDVRNGREISAPLRQHAGAVNAVAVSPDGLWIVSGGLDGTVRRWRSETGEEVQPPLSDSTGEVRGVAISPDGKSVLSAPAERGSSVKLWDLQNGTLLRAFESPKEDTFYGVAFSPDGHHLLATTYEGSVWIWDSDCGQTPRELSGHRNYVICAAFSPAGDRVLSASYDQTLRLWDARTGEVIRILKGHTAGVRGVAFVGGDSALSCSMDGSLKLWNLETGEAIRTFAGHGDGVRGVAVSSNQRRAISAGVDGTLMVWNLARNAEAMAVHEDDLVTSLSSTGNGWTLVSGDAKGSVKLRDLATFRVLRTFTTHTRPIDTAAVLPDGRRLFAADHEGGYWLWEISSGRELHHEAGQDWGEDRDGRGRVWCFTAVSPDGSQVLTSRPGGKMDLRSIESGNIIHSLPAVRQDGITCVAISPDSKYALSGDEGNRIHYWDLEKGLRLSSTSDPAKKASLDCVVFSADGTRALSGGHELTIRLWDLTSDPIRQIREFVGPTLVVEAVGFGREGRTLFSVGRDQNFRMWDIETARQLNLPAQFLMSCYAMAVVPPGDAVLIGSGMSVSLWNIPRFRRHAEFASRLEDAIAALGPHPDDALALKTLGEWYAFRGVNDWAVEFLERARLKGADVSSLTLARCYWQLDWMAEAAREFRSAASQGEVPPDYGNLCLSVMTAPVTASRPATAPAAGRQEHESSRDAGS